MKKSDLFKNEIKNIISEDYRMFAEYYMDECVPNYFYEIGASSSGKYHPGFSQGVGGLVRHTKAVVMFCQELLNLSTYAYMKEEYKDYAIMACIFHDTVKYGFEYDTSEYKKHSQNAAKNVNKAWCEYFGTDAPELLLMAIRSHMGQWEPNKDDRPFTNLDRLVHMSDYIASRSFIDIPQVVIEYNATVRPEIPDEELPF